MPKTDLIPENKSAQSTQANHLKLKYNETALIHCIEPAPEKVYVHVLQAPALGPDGRIIRDPRTNKKTGEEYYVTRMDYFGSHMCTGDFNTVESSGIDPSNCLGCKAVAEEEGFIAPEAKYATNVIRYALEPGSFSVRDPYSVEIIPWRYSQKRFDELVDLAQIWNGLGNCDLRLGPCVSEDYQNFPITAQPNPAYKATDPDPEINRKKVTANAYAKTKVDDLAAVIVRPVDTAKMMEDIARMRERIQDAYHPSNAAQASQQKTEPTTLADDAFDIFRPDTDDAGNSKNEAASSADSDEDDLEKLLENL